MTAAPIPYERFTTGYTYREVSDMIWYRDEWHKAHHTRRRHAVLGLWREIKREMYERYLAEVQVDATADDCTEVPF